MNDENTIFTGKPAERRIQFWIEKYIPLTNLKSTAITLIFILLGIFPFGIGTIEAIDYYSHYRHFKIEFILVILFGFGICILVSRKNFKITVSEPVTLAAVILLTIIIRWLAIIFFNVQPTSDFQNAFNSASLHLKGPYEDLTSARYPYWGFYIITLSLFLKILGATLNGMKLFNLLLSAFTITGLYFLGKKISSSRKFAVITSLTYAFWPAEIMYKNLPTGEHVFVALFPFVCLLFIHALQFSKIDVRKAILFLLPSGLVLGLMDLYKPVAIVLLIAFIIVILLRNDKTNQPTVSFLEKKKVLFSVVLITALLVSYWAAKEFGFFLIKQQALLPPNKFGFGSTLRVGLDPDLGGRFTKEISVYLRDLITEHNDNYEYVNSFLINETKQIIKNHSASEYRDLFVSKFQFAWSSEWIFFHWIVQKQIDNGLTSFDPVAFGEFITPWSDAYYIFLLIFSTIGSLYCAVYRKDEMPFSIGLFILGFSLLLLLTEVQGRYRSVLFSAIPIYTAYGIHASGQLISFLQKSLKRNPSPSTP